MAIGIVNNAVAVQVAVEGAIGCVAEVGIDKGEVELVDHAVIVRVARDAGVGVGRDRVGLRRSSDECNSQRSGRCRLKGPVQLQKASAIKCTLFRNRSAGKHESQCHHARHAARPKSSLGRSVLDARAVVIAIFSSAR